MSHDENDKINKWLPMASGIPHQESMVYGKDLFLLSLNMAVDVKCG